MRYLALALVLLPIFAFADDKPADFGHSRHGSAFDTGMRTKPWKMQGIGHSPFPITCKNKEVQEWYDQGNALMHSFWFEEAERSFRWCLKLDPENPMVYFGLARTGMNWFAQYNPPAGPGDPMERYREFLKRAVKLKDKATDRERMYIETWDDAYAPGNEQVGEKIAKGLQSIVLKYPEDLEAKALLALYNIGAGSPYANQLVINEVLAKNPGHPGAHHASIHNWDAIDSVQAIRSCEAYGKAAPGVGHSLHMPGHIYSKIGMWHEAALAMDSATRVELQYMNDRLALPFETWNFVHNRNYLCYIQEQLGMAEAAIKGAKDLLNAPKDPEYNPQDGGGFYWQGHSALVRALVKFERWDEILKPGELQWKPDDRSKAMRLAVETLAHNGKGQAFEAKEKVRELKTLGEKFKDEYSKANYDLLSKVVEGQVLLSEGNTLDGQRILMEAATLEDELRAKHWWSNDPPDNPWTVWRLVGDAYLKRGDYRLACEAYERALRNEPNDGFALSGIAQACAGMGEKERAKNYAGRFAHVWSNADPGLKWVQAVASLDLKAKPIQEGPATERIYRPADLDKIGPSNWAPFMAPKLEVTDPDGKTVRLEDYRGKKVLLVFYIGEECVHCVEQLQAINARASDFGTANTVILAVSSDTPEKNKGSLTLAKLDLTLLSDKDHENARRFASYDDFEDLELHSTMILDEQGRLRWKRTGGDPFMNIDFLLSTLRNIK